MAGLRNCKHCRTPTRFLYGVRRLCARCNQAYKDDLAEAKRTQEHKPQPRTRNAEPLVYHEVRRRRQLEPDLTMYDLAERYGLNPSIVARILREDGLTNRDDEHEKELLTT